MASPGFSLYFHFLDYAGAVQRKRSSWIFRFCFRLRQRLYIRNERRLSSNFYCEVKLSTYSTLFRVVYIWRRSRLRQRSLHLQVK